MENKTIFFASLTWSDQFEPILGTGTDLYLENRKTLTQYICSI